jgi:RimJ/RimL family protein N-acetyltransferase
MEREAVMSENGGVAPDGPILNITGELVALGPLRRDLIPLYQRWMNDFQVLRTLSRSLAPMTLDAESAWFENASKSNPTNIPFTMYECATLRPIGNTSLFEIDYKHRLATFGIAIGERDCWGKGYGTETARLMLDYGFNALDLHNIMLVAFSHNERGLTAYRKAGFKEAGRRREAYRLAGRAYDEVMMDCLATEFDSPVLRAALG